MAITSVKARGWDALKAGQKWIIFGTVKDKEKSIGEYLKPLCILSMYHSARTKGHRMGFSYIIRSLTTMYIRPFIYDMWRQPLWCVFIDYHVYSPFYIWHVATTIMMCVHWLPCIFALLYMTCGDNHYDVCSLTTMYIRPFIYDMWRQPLWCVFIDYHVYSPFYIWHVATTIMMCVHWLPCIFALLYMTCGDNHYDVCSLK